MPNAWGLPRYNTVFADTCVLGASDHQRLKEKIANHNANDSDSTFDSDAPLSADTGVDFFINSRGKVRLRVDGFTQTIRKVSDLPGVDRVIRPSEAVGLSAKQRELYKEFTNLLTSHKILFTGTFHCASRINGASENDRDAKIVGDRPVPVYADYLDPNLRLRRELTFGLGRMRGRRLMHCSLNGNHYPNEYRDEVIIYLGADNGERVADADVTGKLELHERLCTQIREFSTDIVALSPLATCGTDRIQACYYSACNCFYCRNHSPISWSLEIAYTDYRGRKQSALIESLSFCDGGMEVLRGDAPKDGGPLPITAGRLFIDHNGRLERWAVKQSRIGDLERTAERYGFSDRDKLLFTVINASLWRTKPSKCYLGGDSIYDPDHYAPCASEVMGVTLWYTPSGSWVTIESTLVFNQGVYHLETANSGDEVVDVQNNSDDVVEVQNIRLDVKVVGKTKRS